MPCLSDSGASQRATVLQALLETRAIADLFTPSTLSVFVFAEDVLPHGVDLTAISAHVGSLKTKLHKIWTAGDDV